MTLRQDPQQPLTRRQLRELERAASAQGGTSAVADAPREARPTVEAPSPSVPPVALPFAAPIAPAEPATPANTPAPVPEAQSVPASEAPAVFRRRAQPDEVEPVTAPIALVEPAPLRPELRTPEAGAQPALVPLTRRQLRELRQAQEASAEAAASAHATATQEPTIVAPAPAASAPEPISSVPEALAAEDGVPVVAEPEVIENAPAPAPSTASAPAEPELIEQAPADDAPTEEPVAEASADDDDDEGIDDVDRASETGRVRAYQPPTGHWSLGTGETFDDVIAQGVEEAHSRQVEVSGASTSSSALIIPVVPSVADMTGPLNATGEILLTGTIDLPRSYGATGQLPNRFDGRDVDAMLDHREDSAVDHSSVAPMAATRAISTHEPTRTMITPPDSRRHNVGRIAGIAGGGAAAVLVAAGIVAGFVFHVF